MLGTSLNELLGVQSSKPSSKSPLIGSGSQARIVGAKSAPARSVTAKIDRVSFMVLSGASTVEGLCRRPLAAWKRTVGLCVRAINHYHLTDSGIAMDKRCRCHGCDRLTRSARNARGGKFT